MKIKCPACHFENEEGSKFCKNCNVPLFKQDYSEDNPYIKKNIKEEKMRAEIGAFQAEKAKTEKEEEEKKGAEARAKAEKEIEEEGKEKQKIEEQKLVEVLKGRLESAFNDNIGANEKVDVKMHVANGEGIVVTDRRVMIIKAGMGKSAGLFGVNCKSFYFNQITSVDLRTGLFGGHIQLTIPESTEIKGDMAQAENAVTFTTNYKERIKYVANLIRERIQSSQNPSHINQDTSGASLVDQINELAKLKQQGILSEEEFQIAKKKLLS